MWLIGSMKVMDRYKISAHYPEKIMRAKPKTHKDMGCEYHYR